MSRWFNCALYVLLAIQCGVEAAPQWSTSSMSSSSSVTVDRTGRRLTSTAFLGVSTKKVGSKVAVVTHPEAQHEKLMKRYAPAYADRINAALKSLEHLKAEDILHEQLHAVAKKARATYDAVRVRLQKRQAAEKMTVAETSLNNVGEMYYFGNITIGSPQQMLPVIFDTGSSNMWLLSTRCTDSSEACQPDNAALYDHTRSSTYRQTSDSTAYIAYGTGSVYVLPGTDDITLFSNLMVNDGSGLPDESVLGALTLEDAQFNEAVYVPGSTFTNTGFSGLFGLGYPSLAVNHQAPPFYQLWKNGQVRGEIGVFLGREESEIGGLMTFGGYEADLFIGTLQWHPVVTQAYWEIDFKGLTFGSDKVFPLTSGSTAAIDTGTSLIATNAAQSNLLNAWIMAGGQEPTAEQIKAATDAGASNDGITIVDCKLVKTLPELTFRFAGGDYPLPADDYIIHDVSSNVCYSAITPIEGLSNPMWVIGDAFLMKYYSVYSLEKNAVGLAPAVDIDQM